MGPTSTYSEELSYTYVYPKQECVEDLEEHKYKKEIEKFATIHYRSKVISRIFSKPMIVRIKKFKQKMNGRT